jgi:hypothetical protein
LQSNTLDEINVRVYGDTALVPGLAMQFQQTRVTPSAG